MKAECTWGEGPDVLVVLGGTPIMSYENPVNVSGDRPVTGEDTREDVNLCWSTHGFIRQGSFDLTADEALQLAGDLILAANSAKELDYMAANYKPGQPTSKLDKDRSMRPEIKEMLDDIKAGKPLKIKRTKMRVPIKDGKEDWDNAEKISEKEEEL